MGKSMVEQLYTAVIEGVAVSVEQDLFEIVAPSDSRVRIRQIEVGQISDAGDSEAELLGVRVIRGHTSAGSGGSSVTPVAYRKHTGAPSAASAVAINNTTPASGGGETLIAVGWNVQHPLELLDRAARELGIILEAGERMVVRLSVPTDSITVYGTITFEEIGLIA